MQENRLPRDSGDKPIFCSIWQPRDFTRVAEMAVFVLFAILIAKITAIISHFIRNSSEYNVEQLAAFSR